MLYLRLSNPPPHIRRHDDQLVLMHRIPQFAFGYRCAGRESLRAAVDSSDDGKKSAKVRVSSKVGSLEIPSCATMNCRDTWRPLGVLECRRRSGDECRPSEMSWKGRTVSSRVYIACNRVTRVAEPRVGNADFGGCVCQRRVGQTSPK